MGMLVLSLLGYHNFDFYDEYGEKWCKQRTYLINTEIVQGESLKFGVTPDFPRGFSAWVSPVQSLDKPGSVVIDESCEESSRGRSDSDRTNKIWIQSLRWAIDWKEIQFILDLISSHRVSKI